MKKKFLGIALVFFCVLTMGKIVSAESQITYFNSIYDLINSRGASGTVVTRGHTISNDGASMTWEIRDSNPGGVLGYVSVVTADGKFAVPKDQKRSPSSSYNPESAQDALKRALTFVDAGNQLIWDSSRLTPMDGTIVHEEYEGPYAITCSTLVAPVLAGYDYSSTTYVSDKNTIVGDYVDFGAAPETMDLSQGWKLAKWLYINGDMWLHDRDNPQYQPGDVMFFSDLAPEGSSHNNGRFFGNIFHAGIYLGDGKIVHSFGIGSETGVVVQNIADNSSLPWRLTWIVRPDWVDFTPDVTPEATTEASTTTSESTTMTSAQTTEATTEAATTTKESTLTEAATTTIEAASTMTEERTTTSEVSSTTEEELTATEVEATTTEVEPTTTEKVLTTTEVISTSEVSTTEAPTIDPLTTEGKVTSTEERPTASEDTTTETPTVTSSDIPVPTTQGQKVSKKLLPHTGENSGMMTTLIGLALAALAVGAEVLYRKSKKV